VGWLLSEGHSRAFVLAETTTNIEFGVGDTALQHGCHPLSNGSGTVLVTDNWVRVLTKCSQLCDLYYVQLWKDVLVALLWHTMASQPFFHSIECPQSMVEITGIAAVAILCWTE
jgi:hypothetical protein